MFYPLIKSLALKVPTAIKIFLTGLLLLPLLAGDAITTTKPEKALKKAEDWYWRRAEGCSEHKASPEPINNAIKYARQALQNPSTEAKAAVILLKSYHYKAKYVPMAEDEKQELLKQGRDFGKKMSERYPNNEAIKFWYMGNLGDYGQTLGVVSAARQGIGNKIKALCEELIETAPEYDDAGPYRVLGVLHFKLPNIPFVISWPDDGVGLDYLEKAADIAPENPANLYYYARLLYEEGYYDKAKEVMKGVSQREPRERHLLEERNTLKKAREYHQKWSN